jgi:hypothetical protein
MWGSRTRKDKRAVKSREGANAGLPEESWFSALDGSGERTSAFTPTGSSSTPVLWPLAGNALRRIFGTYVAARG